jgi:hypothetical protein
MVNGAPLIKEHRLDIILLALACIDEHAFDRARQVDCILSLYPAGRSEKSVVRGMVIPSCRHLGLILGSGRSIRLSANGKIMLESAAYGTALRDRVYRAVLYEVDREAFGFVDYLANRTGVPAESFVHTVRAGLGAPSDKQADERTRHWLAMLEQVNLVYRKDDAILKVGHGEYEQTLHDLDSASKDVLAFRNRLFDAYADLTAGTAPVADIPDLRERVAVEMLRSDQRLILTEAQFDHLLERTPLATDEYVVSLGRPMGAQEKLFRYQGSYFRTLSIRFLKREKV